MTDMGLFDALPLFGDRAAAYEALNVPANMELACVIPVG